MPLHERKRKYKRVLRRQGIVKMKEAGCFLKRFFSHCLFKHYGMCLSHTNQTPYSPLFHPPSTRISNHTTSPAPPTRNNHAFFFRYLFKDIFLLKNTCNKRSVQVLSTKQSSSIPLSHYSLQLCNIPLGSSSLFGKYGKIKNGGNEAEAEWPNIKTWPVKIYGCAIKWLFAILDMLEYVAKTGVYSLFSCILNRCEDLTVLY